MSQKNSEKGKKTNFHVIDLQWAHQLVPEFRENDIDVEVRVTSRKIKNQTVSPPDILFRTHHYEFELRPNAKFLSLHERGRYVVELKLLKNSSHLKRRLFYDENGLQTGESVDSPDSPVTPSSSTPLHSQTNPEGFCLRFPTQKRQSK
ncbi:hypothetical protein AKO1_004305 [Acrasis kona]|uniref:Uncharacterized protein n=1 Tax=Acrasis kona TaxID=1008807 RepID=A0AAW2Z5U7_9EUKA